MQYWIAGEAWDMLEQERIANIGNAGSSSGPLRFREDSITDYLLWKLYTTTGPFRIHKVRPSLEAKNGADFEVWARATADAWLGLRFQAKRIHRASYKELKHISRNTRQHHVTARWQHDDLLQSSYADNMLALYVFYNEWEHDQFGLGSWPINPSEHLLLCTQQLVTEDPRAFGCGIMAATDVRNVFLGDPAGRKVMHLPKFFPLQLPWHYLWKLWTSSAPAGSSQGQNSCPSCSEAIFHLLPRAMRGHPGPALNSSIPGVWKHDTLPSHVLQMLRGPEMDGDLDFGGWTAPRYTVIVDQPPSQLSEVLLEQGRSW